MMVIHQMIGVDNNSDFLNRKEVSKVIYPKEERDACRVLITCFLLLSIGLFPLIIDFLA